MLHSLERRIVEVEEGGEVLKMFYDLNVPYAPNDPELPRTISFLAERESSIWHSMTSNPKDTDILQVGYSTLALTHTQSGKLPSTLSPPPPIPLPFPVPTSLKLLTRCTLIISDTSHNHRLSSLQSHYNILALRPMNEKALQQACTTLDCDIISLDFSTRIPYHFKHKMLASAISRGIRFEICYSAALAGGADARRYLITNATALIRTTRGRGIVISSEARRALGCRAPWDVVNLATVWGMKQDRGKEAVCEEARKVVVRARMVRESWRGAVEVKYGGEAPKVSAKEPEENMKGKGKGPKLVVSAKRKATDVEDKEEVEALLSKREMKRRAKKARQDAALQVSGTDTINKENTETSTLVGVETETATPTAVQNGG